MRFAFSNPPQPGHLIRVFDDKLSIITLPRNHPLVLLFLQQLQDEVPQLDLPGAGARLGLVGPVWEGDAWGEGAG